MLGGDGVLFICLSTSTAAPITNIPITTFRFTGFASPLELPRIVLRPTLALSFSDLKEFRSPYRTERNPCSPVLPVLTHTVAEPFPASAVSPSQFHRT